VKGKKRVGWGKRGKSPLGVGGVGKTTEKISQMARAKNENSEGKKQGMWGGWWGFGLNARESV